MRKFLLLPILLILVTAIAEERIIRSGTLRDVRQLTAAPTIAELEKSPYIIPPQPVFIAVKIKLAELRTLSILDYSLLLDGRIIPCVALSGQNAPDKFRYTTEIFREPGIYRLLFIVDMEQWKRKQSLKLSSNLPPVNIYEISL